MKKIISVPQKRIALGLNGSDFERIQGHCFGYAIYHYFTYKFPEHTLVQQWNQGIVLDSKSIQEQHIVTKQNNPNLFLKFPGFEERISNATLCTQEQIKEKLTSLHYPFNADGLPDDFIFYFSVCAEEGHAVYVSLDRTLQSAIVIDSMNQLGDEIIELKELDVHLFRKILASFIQHESKPLAEGYLPHWRLIVYKKNPEHEETKKRKSYVIDGKENQATKTQFNQSLNDST